MELRKSNIYKQLFALGFIYSFGIVLLISVHLLLSSFIANFDKKINNERVRVEIGKLIIENINTIESNFYRLLSAKNIANQNIIHEETIPHFKAIDNALIVLKNGGTLIVATPLNLENISKISKKITFTPRKNSYALEIIDLKPKLDNLNKQMDKLLLLVNKREQFIADKNILELTAIKDSIFAFGKLVNSEFVRFRENANRSYYNGTLNLQKLELEIEESKSTYNIIKVVIVLFILVLIFISLFVVVRQINRANKKLIASQLEMKKAKEEIEETNIKLNKEIKERTIAEKALQTSEDRLKILINSIPDIVCFKDGEGRWLQANDADLELFQLKSVDYFNKTDYELSFFTAPIYKEAFAECMQSDVIAFEKGNVSRAEETIPTIDGLNNVYDVIKVPLFNDDGSRKGLVVIGRDITHRKIAENKLAESEEKFCNLVENLGEGVGVVDSEERFVFANSAADKIFDLQPGELIGKSLLDLFDDETSAFFKTQTELRRKGEPGRYNISFVDKDNKERHLTVTATPQVDEDGKFIGTLGVFGDVTEQRLATEALRDSEERYSNIVDGLLLGIAIYIDTKIVFANKTILSMLGLTSEEEYLGKSILEFVPPEEHQKVISIVKSLLEDSTSDDVNSLTDSTLIKKDGSLILAESMTVKINYYGKPALMVMVNDVTKRKKGESEILKLSNAIEQTPVSIVITDIAGNIEYVNPKFTEVTGYTSEEANNQNPRVLKSGEQSDEFYKNLWVTISSGNIWSGEFHNKKKNGELFWESAIISPVKDDEGKITHYVAVKEDITEKRAMLEELVLSKEKTENAAKMKDVFLAQMSHEIRTPINALVSMASLLRYDFEKEADEDQLMSFDVIDRAGGRIIRTVDLLLNLSEIQAGTYEMATTQFDIVSDVLSILIAEYKKTAKKKNINLKLESNMVDTELVADSYTVNQIFTQLIDNAVKYTEEGEVTIKALRNESDQLVVEIKDTGIGIEEEYLPNLFEPFSQEEMGYTRKFEGNGIGMALVNKYCELNNAIIEVESQKGVGSTFRVIF